VPEVHLKKTKLVFTIERHQKPRKIASFYKVKKKKKKGNSFSLCVYRRNTALPTFLF